MARTPPCSQLKHDCLTNALIDRSDSQHRRNLTLGDLLGSLGDVVSAWMWICTPGGGSDVHGRPCLGQRTACMSCTRMCSMLCSIA